LVVPVRFLYILKEVKKSGNRQMGKYSSRYKPVGWQGESQRHYLAAKGIKTKKYFVPMSMVFNEETQDYLKGNRDESPTGSSALLHSLYQDKWTDSMILARRNENPKLEQAAQDIERKRTARRSTRKYDVPSPTEFSQFSRSSVSSAPIVSELPTPPIPEEMSQAPVVDMEEQVVESSTGSGVVNPIVTPGVPPAPIEGARLLE